MSQDLHAVTIKPALIGNPEELGNFLEGLYLTGGYYELHFQLEHLHLMERTFDQIIQKHGIKATNFIYNIVES